MSSTFLRRLLGIALAATMTPGLAKNLPPVNFVGCALDKTLFFSYTKDRQYAVEVCEVKDGYRYTFGRFTVVDADKTVNKLSGVHKKLKLAAGGAEQAVLKPGELGRIHRDVHAGFALKRGNVFTWLEADTNGEVNLVTADSGWDGWQTAENRKAVALDSTGWGYINEIEHVQMVPFIYDYTNVDYD